MNSKKTYDELAEEYADEVELDSNTYRGDVVTAFVMGMMKQDELKRKRERQNKNPYIGKNPLGEFPHPFDPKAKRGQGLHSKKKLSWEDVVDNILIRLRVADFYADAGSSKAGKDVKRFKKILNWIKDRTGINWFEKY